MTGVLEVMLDWNQDRASGARKFGRARREFPRPICGRGAPLDFSGAGLGGSVQRG
jgi:hypothetical protein